MENSLNLFVREFTIRGSTAHAYILTCTHTYIQTGRQAGKQAGRQTYTDMQMDRQIERLMDKQIDMLCIFGVQTYNHV